MAITASPSFFKVDSGDSKGSPWASGVYAPSVEQPCPVCGKPMTRFTGGVAEARIDEKGVRWTDAIGSGIRCPSFIVSERVVAGLRACGVVGFDDHPVRIAEVRSKRLRDAKPPEYRYLVCQPDLMLDLVTRTSQPMEQCPACFKRVGGASPLDVLRLIPRAGSWGGLHLFTLRNYPLLVPYCTTTVLEKARSERWTNFRFEPIDVDQSMSPRWRGIDYLGRKWPPQWYPDEVEG